MTDPDLFALTHGQLSQGKSARLLILLAIAFCFAGAWMAWLLFARVTVYASTDQARVEVAQAVYPVEAAVSGRVKKGSLKLGRRVEKGDWLVELEADPEQLRLSQEQSHQQALETQLQNLRGQLSAELEALGQERRGGEAVVEQARARLVEAQESAKFAAQELQRDRDLFKQGLTAEIELQRSISNAKQKSAEAEASATAVQQASSLQLSTGGEHRARIEAVKTEIAQVEGEVAASETIQRELQHEIAAYRIEAPSAGRLGSIVSIKPGAYIRQGDRLATIIPDGRLRIVAEFEPHTVIGRVKPGQSARLRLSGFPWTQYGSIQATVISVGSEVRDGRVRVELEPRSNGEMRLQHGLPGTLEVAIDYVSPLMLLLEKAGAFTSAQQPASTQVASR